MRPRGHGAVRQAEEAVTVGFYSPLPPARTGVADYAAALLAALRRLGPVEVAPERCDVAALSHRQQPPARRTSTSARSAVPASWCCTMLCCIISCWAA